MAQPKNIENQLECFDEYWERRKDTPNVQYGYLQNTAVVEMENRVLYVTVNGSEDCCSTDNSLFGKTMACVIGDGIIEFAEAPFKKEIEKAKEDISLAISRYAAGSDELCGTITAAIRRVMGQSHYTMAFPPKFTAFTQAAAEEYFAYLLLLQEEYHELLPICFAQTPYEEDIKGFTAVTRYYLFCMINNSGPLHSLTYHYTCRRVTKCIEEQNGRAFTTEVTDSLTPARYKKYLEGYKAAEKASRTEPNSFEQAYHLPATFTELYTALPAILNVEYEISRLDEVLMLEFENMLRLDLRIRKCKNCGRYFVLKGSYQTDYCDKIPEGETKPCQTLAATEKYAHKVNECPPLAIYNKIYKRLHSRMKAGTLPQVQFEQWKQEAKKLRDQCVLGEIDEEDFKNWLSNYKI